ncbi:MAG TPA: efflux RND transporter permease subunit [Salinivirgaceae bacterium]|nr:efflux RND transporter permease subunit [Salinivirgaceae bacterium]
MKHLSELVFRRKSLFFFLLTAIVVGGLLSYRSISKLEDPEIVVFLSKVITIYPGASAHEVEMQVTNVLEDALSELPDIESIRSRSSANISIIDVELKMTVPQHEIPQRWEFMRRKIQKVLPNLPKGVQAPMILDDIGDVYGMFYSLTTDGASYRELSDYAQYLKKNLLRIKGVNKVAIYGEQPETIEIIFTPEHLATMGIFPAQIVAALNDYTATLFAGNYQTNDQNLRIHVNGNLTSPEELGNIVIKGLKGELFLLKDIAKIERTYAKPLHNTLFVNNKPAIGISISMESGENIIELGERVESYMATATKNLPAGYKLEKVFFQPDIVRKAISDFMINLIMSVAIVILVLMLTMNLRSGVIIGSGLLFTILATFPFLQMAGGTMHRISLGAFIVAMGMLVDNAIVVLDGILVQTQTRGRIKTSFVQPAKKTAWPLLGATLIAALSFLPAILSRDTAGTYIHDLFIVLCVSLLISWILALTQVPLFAAMFIKKELPAEKSKLYGSRGYEWLKNTLEFFLHHKIVTTIAALILLGLSAYGFFFVKQTFFPDFNYNQVYIEYKLPFGTSPDKVNADLHDISEYLLKHPEVTKVTTSQGMSPTRYCLVRPLGEMSDNYGELLVDFKDYRTMIRMKPIFEDYLRQNYPDAYLRIRKYNLSVKASHTVEVEFTGPDPAVLKRLADSAMVIMHQSPFIDRNTICTDWEPTGNVLVAQYQSEIARRNNTGRTDVALALLAATDGLPITKVYDGQNPVNILLKIRNRDGSKPIDLDDIPVWNLLPNIDNINQETISQIFMGQKTFESLKEEIIRSVPLSSITKGITLMPEEQVVRRLNGRRSIQAQCEPLADQNPAIARQNIKQAIEAIPLPEGYTVQWVGEYELQTTALRNIFQYLPLTILIIVAILIVLFNDYRKPLIVLLCIPMAIIGIVPGLLITSQPYTFIAIIGTFGLIGMLVKNSIVLIDEIEDQRRHGCPAYTSIVKASIARTRPVLMASITTILGMLPLLTDPMYSSMAVTIISGLLVGTIITLIFVPILYAVFFKIDTSKPLTNLTVSDLFTNK